MDCSKEVDISVDSSHIIHQAHAIKRNTYRPLFHYNSSHFQSHGLTELLVILIKSCLVCQDLFVCNRHDYCTG